MIKFLFILFLFSASLFSNNSHPNGYYIAHFFIDSSVSRCKNRTVSYDSLGNVVGNSVWDSDPGDYSVCNSHNEYECGFFDSNGNFVSGFVSGTDCLPCPSGQFLGNDGQCHPQCQPGEYLKNDVCVPYCEPPFEYITKNGKSFCKAPAYDKPTCLKHDYHWFDNTAFRGNPFIEVLPTGCYYSEVTAHYINLERKKLLNALSVVGLPGLGITVESAGSAFIAKFKKIFAGAKSLWDFIKDKFSSNNVNSYQDLSNQNIKITDLKMSDNGVEPIIDLTPLEDLPDDASWSVPTDHSKYDGTLTADTFDFSDLSLSDSEFDNLPAEIPEYTDNIIGTKNILDTSLDFSSYLDDATEINTPVKSKINLSDSLVSSTDTKQFDLDTIKIAEDDTGTYPITKYKQTVKYPDASITTLDIVKTDLGDNGFTYDITTTTPLKNGDTFEKTYHIQKSKDGTTINTFQDPSTITKINPDGSTSIVPNSAPDTTISTKTGTSLVPITNELKTLETKQDLTNQKLDKIDTKLKDMIDYVPPVNEDFDQSLKNFKDALTDFDLNMSNFANYLSNFQSSLQDLKTNFDNAKTTLENKPTFTQNTGTCGFSIHAFRQDFNVDPCLFVTPYRPILVVFFTLMGSFAVIIFAVKFLISKGAE